MYTACSSQWSAISKVSSPACAYSRIDAAAGSRSTSAPSFSMSAICLHIATAYTQMVRLALAVFEVRAAGALPQPGDQARNSESVVAQLDSFDGAHRDNARNTQGAALFCQPSSSQLAAANHTVQ